MAVATASRQWQTHSFVCLYPTFSRSWIPPTSWSAGLPPPTAAAKGNRIKICVASWVPLLYALPSWEDGPSGRPTELVSHPRPDCRTGLPACGSHNSQCNPCSASMSMGQPSGRGPHSVCSEEAGETWRHSMVVPLAFGRSSPLVRSRSRHHLHPPSRRLSSAGSARRPEESFKLEPLCLLVCTATITI